MPSSNHTAGVILVSDADDLLVIMLVMQMRYWM